MNRFVEAFICHLIGDYVLQNDYIAKTKCTNWYHLLVHSVLYCVPFIFLLELHYIFLLAISHFIIDAAKARYNVIDYKTDQILHYIILLMLII